MSAPVVDVDWPQARRIIRAVHPPIDLFEDIADPADWPLILSAMQKTNPRVMDNVGNLDLVPAQRRVSGPGASHLMAPFTHASPDRPSRFSDGSYGVLYVASDFETAVAETIYHHARFMAATAQSPGWTPHFRELSLGVSGALHDLRAEVGCHDPDDYAPAQAIAATLRGHGGEGVLYGSVRGEGDCVGLFYPDLARDLREGRGLDYHWDGSRVDLVREVGTGRVWRVGA